MNFWDLKITCYRSIHDQLNRALAHLYYSYRATLALHGSLVWAMRNQTLFSHKATTVMTTKGQFSWFCALYTYICRFSISLSKGRIYLGLLSVAWALLFLPIRLVTSKLNPETFSPFQKYDLIYEKNYVVGSLIWTLRVSRNVQRLNELRAPGNVLSPILLANVTVLMTNSLSITIVFKTFLVYFIFSLSFHSKVRVKSVGNRKLCHQFCSFRNSM